MGKIVYTPAPKVTTPAHYCCPPTRNSCMKEYVDYPIGTVWRCDCGTEWRLCYNHWDEGIDQEWKKVRWYHRQPWRNRWGGEEDDD